MQDETNAEKNYRAALRLDPRLVNSHLGLAKIQQHREKYALALAEIDAAAKLDPARTDVHYIRGQVLLHLGRKEEAKKEQEIAARAESAAAAQPQKQAEIVPSPELLAEPQ
jgi:Tfp pilus assembly protein PilF